MIKNGLGTLKSIDGGVYEGNWRDNQKHGLGTLKFPDGEIYEG